MMIKFSSQDIKEKSTLLETIALTLELHSTLANFSMIKFIAHGTLPLSLLLLEPSRVHQVKMVSQDSMLLKEMENSSFKFQLIYQDHRLKLLLREIQMTREDMLLLEVVQLVYSALRLLDNQTTLEKLSLFQMRKLFHMIGLYYLRF